MIIGAHIVVNSRDAEADRNFLRDVLHFENVDAGHGWLIFALPPAELAFHPAEADTSHQLYFLTEDLPAALRRLHELGVPHDPVVEARWGSVTILTLPGGSRIGLYQAKHPLAMRRISE